ncbi:Plasmodium exported protein (PHISTa), unknown, putative [Plasmodium sp. gorilla clade G3]|nr:Plasmodium exported protein (PHISTa), unknown, putative [Plasmodium sp. gorilla clade G3]
MNKKTCISFTFYSADVNQKGKLRYNSFRFLCLSLYIIGVYYIFLNNSLENKRLEIAKECNVYIRNLCEVEKNNKGSKKEKNINDKKGDVNKTIIHENNTKSNEQKVEENIYSTNNDLQNNNMENKSNSSMNNINYNDISKNLTEKELFDVLNSLEVCPSKEDLRNIWTHTLAVGKEGLDDIQKKLKASIQKYLDNDFSERVEHSGHKEFVYNYALKGHILKILKAVTSEEIEHTKIFFRLINDKHALDDILKFIYSFLNHFKIFIKELLEKHQKELLKEIEQPLYLWKCRYKFLMKYIFNNIIYKKY